MPFTMFPKRNALGTYKSHKHDGVNPSTNGGLNATEQQLAFVSVVENLSNLLDCLRLSSCVKSRDLELRNISNKFSNKLASREFNDFYRCLNKIYKRTYTSALVLSSNENVVISTAKFIVNNINYILPEKGEIFYSNALLKQGEKNTCDEDSCPVDGETGEPIHEASGSEIPTDSPLGLAAIKFVESRVSDTLVKALKLPIHLGIGIASTIVALCTSLYIAVKCNTMSNVVLFTPVIANFISLFNWFNVWFTVTKMQINVQIDKVEKILNFGFEIINSHLSLDASTNAYTVERPTANALVMPDWVNLISHLFGFALVGSMKLGFGWDFKKIKDSLSIRREILALKTDICEVIKEFACDLGFTDLVTTSAQNSIYYNLLCDINELGLYHVVDFVKNPNRKLLLDETIKEITKLLAANNSKNRELSVIRTTCAKALPELIKIQKLIREALSGNERPATVGFALSGIQGIGKSWTLRLIIRKALALCGLPPDLYNFDFGVNEQYFPQYLAQAGGIYNEFAATIGDNSSKIINAVNKIISGDSCNLEGADLHLKHQPCQLRLVGLTSNHKNFVFNNQLHDEANKALLSRLTVFEVVDPLYNPNEGRDGQSHRMPDASHLEFHKQIYDFTVGQTTQVIGSAKTKKMNIHEVIHELAVHVLQNELAFFKSILHTGEEWSEKDREDLNRLIQGTEDRIQRLPSPITSNAKRLLESNCLIFTLAGAPCKGKTAFMNEVANRFSKTYKLEVVKQPDLANRYNEPKIVVFNDLNIPEQFTNYVNFVDELPELSIVLLTSNAKISCKRYSLFSMKRFERFMTRFEIRDLLNPLGMIKDYLSDKCIYYKYPACLPTTQDGLIRRMGIMSDVFVDNSDTSSWFFTRKISGCFSNYGKIITVDEAGGFHYQGEAIARESTLALFTQFVQEKHALTKRLVKLETVPTMDFCPDVSINIFNFKKFLEKARTKFGLTALCLNQFSKIAEFSVTPGYKDHFKTIVSDSALSIPAVTDDMSINELLETVAYAIKQTDPYCKLSIVLDGIQHIIDQGFIHSRSLDSDSEEDEPLCHGKHGILYWGISPITVSDYCHIRANHPNWTRRIKYNNLNEEDREAFLHRSAEIIKESPNAYRHYIQGWESLLREKAKNMSMCEKILSHKHFPLVAKIFGAIMSVIVLICTMWLLKRKFLNNKDETEKIEKRQANSAEKYQRMGETLQKFLRRKDVGDWYSYAKQQGFSEEDIIDYDNWRHSNGKNNSVTPAVKGICKSLNQAIMRGDSTAAEVLYKSLQDETPITLEVFENVLSPKANAVAVSDEITRNNGIIGVFAERLRENLCKVKGDAGDCYGIFLQKNIFVTVSHIFTSDCKQGKMICTRTLKDGTSTRYCCSFTVKSLNRDKDMAVCVVDDKSFPAMADISKFLLNSVQTVDWSGTCYYVRPFSQIEVYGGTAMYCNRRTPAFDPLNPNYSPRETFVFEATTFMNYPRHIYSIGDCGLPLLTIVANEIRIVGIHNSFTNFGNAWFSPFYKEVFDMCVMKFESNAALPVEVVTGVEDQGVVRANVPDYQDFSIDVATPHTRFPILNTKPEIFQNIRYNKHLAKMKNPTHSVVCNYRRGMQTELSASYSCVSAQYIPTDIVEKVPKTSSGIPEPALTQLLKFENDTVENVDEDIFKQAEEVREQFAIYTYDRSVLKTLSLDHAINGAPDSTMKPIDISTSPGLFLEKKFKMHNKELAFVKHLQPNGTYRMYTSNNPPGVQLRKDFHKILECWDQGTPIRIVCADTKKVEILPLEKINKDANVRIFNVLDTAVNLALRSKFGMYFDQCVRNCNINYTVYAANPYLLYPWLIREASARFNSVISSDVSRMDKQLSPRLIRSIISFIGFLYTGNRQDKSYMAIAESFAKTTHIFQGAVFEVVGGNPSGCYLTCLFNTEARFLIDLYILCRMWRQLPNTITPFADIRENTRILITGDDEQFWFNKHKFPLTKELMLQGYKDFGLTLTIDKNSDSKVPQFCSRFMLKDRSLGIIFPALKKSSIEKMLHYSLPQNEHLIDNVQLAVFESTFWDYDYYRKILHDALYLLKARGLHNSVYLCEYTKQREHFARYVRGYVSCPLLTERGAELLQRNMNIEMADSNITISNESENWISLYNVHNQKDPEQYPIPTITGDRKPNGEWFLTGRTSTATFTGAGPNKTAAKQQIYKQFVLSHFEDSATANAVAKRARKHKHTLAYTIDESPAGNGVSVTVMVDDKVVYIFEAPTETFARNQLKEYITSDKLFQNFPVKTVEVDIQAINHANSQVGTQVKPNMAGASGVPQGSNDGSNMAPQATSVAGSVGPPSQVLNATGGANEVVVLNPQGPANLMSQGGVTFDLKNIIYDQFIDKDVEITVSDSIPIGTKLFEIPYDPNGEYMNDYIQSYMRYHSRFNGDIIIRVEVIGNPMFTGAICVGWSPEQIPGTIISAAQYQKYAYKVFSMQQSSVQEFILKDARQYQYYRDTDTFRKGDQASKVPFLTGVCHVTIQNALKEGALVRIRIGSRLASQADLAMGKLVTPFCFSNPLPIPNSVTPGSKTLDGQTFRQVFPNMVVEYFRGFSDGTQYIPNYSVVNNVSGLANYFSLKASMPCLIGGQFTEEEYKRLVTSSLETHVFGTDTIRVVNIVSQFGPILEAQIAKDPAFTKLTDNKDTWLADAETANCISNAGIQVYVKRNITVALEIYKKDSYVVQLVQQTHFITDKGVAYVWCFTANPPSNDIKYVSPIGIRNASTPITMYYPHSPALGAIVVNQNTATLPVNWRHFVITDDVQTTVVAQTEQAPSMLSTVYILDYFKDLTADYQATECAEFDLVDPVSKDTVITLRYLPVANCFAIKPMDNLNYATYPGDISKLVINRFTKLDSSAVFTQTDTTSWLSRAGESVTLFSSVPKNYSDYVVDRIKSRMYKNRIIDLITQNKSNAAALGLLGEGAIALGESGITEEAVGQHLLDSKFSSLFTDWRLEGIQNQLESLKSPKMVDTGAQTKMQGVESGTQTTLNGTGTRIGYTKGTQTTNNFSVPKNNLNGQKGILPGSGGSQSIINQTLNFGESAGPSATHRTFMQDLALNCIPILLMQSTQSNGNVAGTFENAGFEEMGITKEDYAFQHSMEMERQKESFEKQQQQTNNNFVANQNELNRQQQEQLQKEQFANQEKMQQEQFNFTAGENEKNRAQKEQMQQEQFQNQTAQSNLNFEHSKELQTQKFGEELVTTAVSGGLNLATHAMDDITQVYNTKQQIQGQKELSTQRANQAMYVSGASAQSMQLSNQQ